MWRHRQNFGVRCERNHCQHVKEMELLGTYSEFNFASMVPWGRDVEEGRMSTLEVSPPMVYR